MISTATLHTQMKEFPPTLRNNPELARWVEFHSSGTVIVRPGKVEIGQGIVSAIAQIAAEELDVNYERIRTTAVDTQISPNEGSTSGSRSIQEGGEAMRQACAEIRHAFMTAASLKFGVDIECCTVIDGTFHATGRSETWSYWQLAPEVVVGLAKGMPHPKPIKDRTQVGRSLQRLDIEAKVTGAAFIQDMVLPGMLHGRIVRPPSFRARLLEFDDTKAKDIPGVGTVVRRGSFIGVLAVREELAIKAMQVISSTCVWEESATLPDMNALPDFLTSQPAEHETLCNKADSINSQRADLTMRLRSTFTRPYLAHASIGPSCALARWQGEQLEVWSHSQSIFALRDAIAQALNIAAELVTVRHAEGAGCYGHNGADDVALDAALLSKAALGAPVRVQWMREDEFAWEPLGPAMMVKIEGTVSPQGFIDEWKEEIWGNRHISRPGRHPTPGLLAVWHFDEGFEPPPAADMPLVMGGGSQRNAVPYYDFPNKLVVNHAIVPMPVRTSALRALGAHINVFAIESFMDELAFAAKIDPVEFRLRHLIDDRAHAVIKAAVAKSGWRPGRKGDGSKGTGIGFARYKNIGNYAAVVAEVDIGQTVRVVRVVAAIDCGCVVNPDGVLNQIEGGIVQATSWVLKEQMCFDRTRITSRNWEDYPILTFSEVPTVEVVLLNRPEDESLGVGEGVTGPTAAAIANAVFNAMGVRVRDLPLTPGRVMSAMDQP
jgi:nicotinate dehydrogenase subunit B